MTINPATSVYPLRMGIQNWGIKLRKIIKGNMWPKRDLLMLCQKEVLIKRMKRRIEGKAYVAITE